MERGSLAGGGDGARVRGVGLRAQISLALVTGLALSSVLVGVAADRIATRALVSEREHAAASAARTIASLVGRVDAPAIVVDRAERAVLHADSVIGFELVHDDGSSSEPHGVVGSGVRGDAALPGGLVRAWMTSPDDDDARAPVRLLVLYSVLTSLAILVLCYVLLTRLIVAPVDALRRAAEHLATGRLETRAPVSGAAEIAGLAVALNSMAADLARDRSALTERLAELERTTHSLAEATRELHETQESLVRSEKLASVGRLAAGIAHEIGNPLTAILGLLELLRGGDLPAADQAELLRRAEAETERIHRIIRELLDFARPSAKTDGEASADLAEVVEAAVHLVAPQKDLRRITVQRRLSEGAPRVRGSADRLTQVVLNLLLNATDAIVGEGTIDVSLDVDGDWVELSVADTGPGIAPEVRDRLFEPFVTTKPPGSGTGLGLAVCHGVITELGGTLTAGDAPGGGARFVVRLPTAERAGQTSAERARRPSERPPS